MQGKVNRFAEQLREKFGCPPDFTLREIAAPRFHGALVYLDGLLDVKELENAVVLPLIKNQTSVETLEDVQKIVYYGGNLKEIALSEAEKSVASGCAVLLFGDKAVEIGAKKQA